MFADVKIGEKVVPMLSNAATAIYYKQIFHEDLLVLMNRALKGGESAEGISDITPKLAYIMSIQAEKSRIKEKNFDTFLEWLEQFEAMEIELAAAQILNTYTANKKGSSKPKNA